METIITAILSFIKKIDASKIAQVTKINLLNISNIITFIETPNAVAPVLVQTGEVIVDEGMQLLLGLAKFSYPELSTALKGLISEIGSVVKEVTPDYTSAISALQSVLAMFKGSTDAASAGATLHINNAITVLKGTAGTSVTPLVPQKAPALEAGQAAIPGVHVAPIAIKTN
jgi:hypothetical protein